MKNIAYVCDALHTHGAVRPLHIGSGFFISVSRRFGYDTPLSWLNGATAPCGCSAKGKVVPFLYPAITNNFLSECTTQRERDFAGADASCASRAVEHVSHSAGRSSSRGTRRTRPTPLSSTQTNTNVSDVITTVSGRKPRIRTVWNTLFQTFNQILPALCGLHSMGAAFCRVNA